ncbi:MAG: excinuclease ABC subunit UvrA [Candidatus Binatia bacterium]
MPGKIVIKGARVHNLKSIDLEIPRDRFVVVTGVSGSGKSSLAFDTLYAEGQRRYVESLSADARQFLQQLERPDLDGVDGLSPAIAIQQKTGIFTPRSTVGTVTEIYDYLRLLFARVGQPVCLQCGREISAQSIGEIVDQLMAFAAGTRIFVMARIPKGTNGRTGEILGDLAREGFARVKIDGQMRELAGQIELDDNQKRRIDLIVDRLVLREGVEKRLADSLEVASRFGQQFITIEVLPDAESEKSREITFSLKFACADCGVSFPEVTPRLFSFNSPQGACPLCAGLGFAGRPESGSKPAETRSSTAACAQCKGSRLKAESLAVKLGSKNIAEVASWPVAETIRFLERLALGSRQQVIGRKILPDILGRLRFLVQVGLDYLSLDRPSITLSGGEAQRVRLATQIASRLAGVLYILDEPSIGLHQKDNARLLAILKQLRDLGNSVLVVEHDEETILEADQVIEMGPGAGVNGGEIVAQGTPGELMQNARSLTGQYLSGRAKIPVPPQRRKGTGDFLVVKGAKHNNLADVSVEIPIGAMTCVTGVSGSGKSSLIMDVLYNAVAQRLHRSETKAGAFDALIGWERFDRIVGVDQIPIGRTPRSNPATYTGVYDLIRDLFSQLPEARVRGYGAGRFSFNTSGGRCEACRGDGLVKVDMNFLPDVFVTCAVCQGRRYNGETLQVKYKGLSIADVLDLTVAQAIELLGNVPAAAEKLRMLIEVGLGYLRLGQPAHTLSGGEAQRVKLARELGRRSAGESLYILDEPTSGLHFADIQKLLDVLHRLTDAGNTVIVIEHNLDIIKTADYIIDMGPEGGEKGGKVVARGSPEQVALNPRSFTGQYLAPRLFG